MDPEEEGSLANTEVGEDVVEEEDGQEEMTAETVGETGTLIIGIDTATREVGNEIASAIETENGEILDHGDHQLEEQGRQRETFETETGTRHL